MDRALKERIVGAIILVVFIVLVVPVFLDGPANEPTVVSESVTLPGQNGQPRKRQTIVLERDRSEPVPVSGQADREPPETAPGRSRPPPEPQPSARAAADTPAEAADTPADNTQNEEGSQAAPATATDAPANEPEVEAEDEPQDEPEVEAEDVAPPASDPAPAAPESATGMWAVQLGSFSNKANAERLAAELRGNGFAAFLSQVNSGGKQLHRVRIGPQENRKSAESVASRLAGDGHKGQVVPHP